MRLYYEYTDLDQRPLMGRKWRLSTLFFIKYVVIFNLDANLCFKSPLNQTFFLQLFVKNLNNYGNYFKNVLA